MKPLNPKEIWSITRLAYWYFDRGRLHEAEALSRGLIALDPRNGEAWLYFAESRRHQGDLQAATRAYAEAARHLPDRPDILLRLGRSYLRANERTKARDALLRARACAQEQPGLLHRIEALLQQAS